VRSAVAASSTASAAMPWSRGAMPANVIDARSSRIHSGATASPRYLRRARWRRSSVIALCPAGTLLTAETTLRRSSAAMVAGSVGSGTGSAFISR
jgi:hypothetical protein